MDNTYKIERVKNHYEVHDINGNFILSGDTWDECYDDMVEMFVTDARMETIREQVSA